MDESKLFQNAAKIAINLSNEDIEKDLKVLNLMMNEIGESSLIEEPRKIPFTDKISYNPSKLLLFFTYYLELKYSEIEICLARFIRLIQIIYNIDLNDFEQKSFLDFTSYIFVQQFRNIRDKIDSESEIFENRVGSID